MFEVGQKVKATTTIGDPPSGDSPGGIYAVRGEFLIVRKIGPESFAYPISVSHEGVMDKSFRVTGNEIEAA